MLESASKNFSGSVPVRFSMVLSVDAMERHPSDTVLYRDKDLIVCPTLGSFLPFWYLIIPTQHYLNFSDWERSAVGNSAASQIRRLVVNALGEDADFIWFEHGPSKRGSITGCGVDHAHLHVILDSGFSAADLLQATAQLGVKSWHRSTFDDVFGHRTDEGEYLAFGDSSTGHFKNLLEPVGSQFFRRAVYCLRGNRSDWDYRQHPHQDIAQQSVDRVLNKKVSR